MYFNIIILKRPGRYTSKATASSRECFYIQVPIKNIIKHPLYKSPGKYHDIALLELASDVDFDSSIRPACLWYRPDFPGHTKAVATGWGVVDPRTQRASNELQKVSLTLLENDFCNVLLKTKRNRLWMDGFTADQLCAGELRGGKDTCQVTNKECQAKMIAICISLEFQVQIQASFSMFSVTSSNVLQNG
nr:ovochymase-2-like [Danaus plexippus plexippus]